jgi:hypothetical protein
MRVEAALRHVDPVSVTKFQGDPGRVLLQTMLKPATRNSLCSRPLIASTAVSDGSVKLTSYEILDAVDPPTSITR